MTPTLPDPFEEELVVDSCGAGTLALEAVAGAADSSVLAPTATDSQLATLEAVVAELPIAPLPLAILQVPVPSHRRLWTLWTQL